MANIYTEQQVGNYAHDIDSTGLFEEARRVENYGKQFEQQAQSYEDKAKNTYALALKVQWQSSINDIAANPEFASNPVAMEKEIKNITDKMSAEIVDDDAKTDFLINSITKRNAYVQKAYAQRIKIQEEQYKSSVYNSIYSNIDSIGLSVADGILGVGDGSTLDAILLSDKEIREGINAKDEYGNYIFSDEQRRKFTIDRDNAILATVKTSFDGMTDEQKKRALSSIESDTMIVGSYSDGKDTSVLVNLKDVVSPKTYSDFKAFTKKQIEAETQKIKKQFEEMRLARKVEEYENEKMISIKLADLPTEQQLAVLRKNESLVSPEYYKAKEESILSSKGINAESRADVARELTLAVESVLRSDDEGLDFLKNADKVLIRIEQDYANGRLSTSDKKRLLGMIDRGIVHEMPKLENEWFTFGFEYKDAYDFFLDNLSDQTMADSVFMKYLRKRESGEYSGEQKKALAVSMAKAANDGELYIKTYKNMAELNADIEAGLVSEGESVYVAGEKGTVQGTLSNNKK